MPKALIILALLMCPGTSAGSVKNAPPLESCVSSINVWTSELLPGIGMKNVPKVEFHNDALKQLTYLELRSRIADLQGCIADHPELLRRTDETGLGATLLLPDYEEEVKERYEHFLVRHGLTQEFFDEDVAGKR
jgi:hypothetical protein